MVYIGMDGYGNHCYIGCNSNGCLHHIGGDGGSLYISGGSNRDHYISDNYDNNNDNK